MSRTRLSWFTVTCFGWAAFVSSAARADTIVLRPTDPSELEIDATAFGVLADTSVEPYNELTFARVDYEPGSAVVTLERLDLRGASFHAIQGTFWTLGGMRLYVQTETDAGWSGSTSPIGPAGEVSFDVPVTYSGNLVMGAVASLATGQGLCTTLWQGSAFSRDRTLTLDGTFTFDAATGTYTLDVIGTNVWSIWPCGPLGLVYVIVATPQLTLRGGDPDEDGVLAGDDNCPNDTNPGQEDFDVDGIGDACDDCPDDFINDADGDGLCSNVDNCPTFSNAGQEDFDGDGIGDFCDPDPDGDGVDTVSLSAGPQATLVYDNCPLTPNAGQQDSDGDAVGDACDNCPYDANTDQQDLDADGDGDVCDPCTQSFERLMPGDLLVADRSADPASNGPGAILRVDPDSGVTSLYADSSGFGALESIAVAHDGGLLLVDDAVAGLTPTPVSALRRLDPASCALTTVGWSPDWKDADDVHVGPLGDYLVADESAGKVRRAGVGDPGGAEAANLGAPDALVMLPRDPSLYVSDSNHGFEELVRYDPLTETATALNPGYFNSIPGLTQDGDGGLFVLNVKGTSEVDRVELPSGATSVHVSHPGWTSPTDIALGEGETLFMSDAGNGAQIAPTIEKLLGPGATFTLSNDPIFDEPTGLAVVGLPYVANEIVEEHDPSVAYNPLRDEYFAVWEEDGYVYGRLVQSDGRVQRSKWTLALNLGSRPVVAHQVHTDPSGPTTTGRYLVAFFVPDTGAGDPQLLMIVLDDDLVLVGGGSETVNEALFDRVDVAARPTVGIGNPQAFFVAWSEGGTMRTTSVTVNGTVSPTSNWILGPYGLDPSVAYNSADDEFLVVTRFLGQLNAVRAIGQNFVDGGVQLTPDPGAAEGVTEPDVAYSATQGEYLIAWKDDRFDPEEIFALRVDPLLNPIGSDFLVDGYTANTYFTGTPSRRPAVGALAGSGEWIVAYEETWNDGTLFSPTRVRGRRIGAGGSIGPETTLMPYGQNYNVALATHPASDEVLLVAEHTSSPAVLFPDIWGRLIQDTDGDGRLDVEDNCPWILNSTQEDLDTDGIGDACDAFPDDAGNDVDGDGIAGPADNCPAAPNGAGFGSCVAGVYGAVCLASDECGNGGVCSMAQEDLDFDGVGDACDDDQDGDGVPFATDCDDREPTVLPGAPELCDGLDNDCNGVVDDLPPLMATGMTVADDELSWNLINGVPSYDVVSGTLSKLRSGGWASADVSCEWNDLTDNALPFVEVPLPGDAVWFLVRPNFCGVGGTYDSGGIGQAGPRDNWIAAAPGSCP